MVVTILVDHRFNGFFVFRKGEGVEYVTVLAAAAASVAAIGPGQASLDHAFGWDDRNGWTSLADRRRARRRRRRRAGRPVLAESAKGRERVVTEPEAKSGFRWTASSIGLLVAVILIALMWGYILSPWSKHGDPPTTLEDTSYTAAAEQICATSQAKINALPKAITAKSPEDRAQVLTQANTLVADLVTQLHALQPKVDADRRFTDQWMADWDSYLASRQAYARLLGIGQGRPVHGAGRGRSSDHRADGRLRPPERHAVVSGAPGRLIRRRLIRGV